MKTTALPFIFILVLFACQNASKPEQQSEKIYSLEKVWSTDTLLTTLESVLYDENANIIFVANINGNPSEKDGNGFISKVDVNGNIVELKWVTGLNAPKGMGIHDGKLYVSDINELAIIEVKQAEIKDRVLFKDAGFLNDISIDDSGKVYISDSYTNYIYTYFNGETGGWLSEGLKGANGLLCEKDRLLVAASDFISIDYNTKAINLINDSVNGGDGIAAAGDGSYFVSEWHGEIFLIEPDSSINLLLNTVNENINSADIDYIQKDSLLLVPTFFKNKLVAYKLIVE